jgi:hypothetical protein
MLPRKRTKKASNAADQEAEATEATQHYEATEAMHHAVAEAVQAALPAIIMQIQEAVEPQSGPSYDGNLTRGASAPHTLSDGQEQLQVQIQQHLNDLTGEKSGQNQNIDLCNSYDQGVPVDHYISQAKRVSILAHQYVDFTTLIKKDNEASTKKFSLQIGSDDMLIIHNEQDNQGTANRNIGLWTSQFLVYGTVLCREQPNQALGLFHYLDHIRSMNRLGYDWYKYDQSFRRLHANDPSIYPFSRDIVQLQMQCAPSLAQLRQQNPNRGPASLPKPRNGGGKWDSKFSHNSWDTRPSSGWDRNKSEMPFPKGTCWVYQRGLPCNGRCDWAHMHFCCYCKGDHPAVRCTSNRSEPTDTHPNVNSRGGDRGGDAKPKPDKKSK